MPQWSKVAGWISKFISLLKLLWNFSEILRNSSAYTPDQTGNSKWFLVGWEKGRGTVELVKGKTTALQVLTDTSLYIRPIDIYLKFK